MRNTIQYEQVSRGKPLEETEALAAIQRQAKKHRESIEEFRKAGRTDLEQKEATELVIVEEYLPRQLDRAEVTRLAQVVIQEVGARGPADKGRVMGSLMPKVRGQADGAVVNQVVTQLLEDMVRS
jgi:uncharacterized protein YqeY